jgi:replicative DNA helicase
MAQESCQHIRQPAIRWLDNIRPGFHNRCVKRSIRPFPAEVEWGPSPLSKNEQIAQGAKPSAPSADAPFPRLVQVSPTAPHSIPAEQALLGALMLNNRLHDDLGGRLLAGQFYVPLHAAIFEAIERLINQGREASPVTLRAALQGTAFDADGALYPHLTAMFDNASRASDVRSLAEVIRSTHVQRCLMALGQSLHHHAATAGDDTDAIIESAGAELFRLAETGRPEASVRSIREGLREVIAEAEAARLGSGLSGVSTGYADLDALLGGLQRSDLIVLGARPSMGKTSLLLNIAYNAAARMLRDEANGAAVGVFSLEMSTAQLSQRLLSSAAGMTTQQISRGRVSDGEFSRLVGAAGDLASLPIHIDDTPALSVNALRTRARRMKRQHGVGLIVVDYLQLMTAPGPRNDHNRVQEISAISQALKQVARELDVPVLAASQLSRSVESRDNKRPQLADLRESGSIEQDADIVMFLYREDYYLSRQVGAGQRPGGCPEPQLHRPHGSDGEGHSRTKDRERHHGRAEPPVAPDGARPHRPATAA